MEAIENYKLKSYGFSIEVKISGIKKKATDYSLSIPKFSVPTLALLDSIKTDIVTQINLTSSEVLDQKSVEKIREKFMESASELLKKKLPNLDESTKNILISRLMNEIANVGTAGSILRVTTSRVAENAAATKATSAQILSELVLGRQAHLLQQYPG